MPDKTYLEADPEKWIALVYEAKKAVITDTAVAQAMGIDYHTHKNWLDKGRISTDEDSPFFHYFHEYTRAGKELIEELTGNLKELAEGRGKGEAGPAVTASVAMLKYQQNNSFADKLEVDSTVKTPGPVHIIIDDMTDKDRKKITGGDDD